MMSDNISCRIKRARCWNCRKVVIVPLPIDPVSRIDGVLTYIIPYRIECPWCGDEIYKYMCRDESRFVH